MQAAAAALCLRAGISTTAKEEHSPLPAQLDG